MKQSELEKCAFCDKGMMHNQSPVFYRVKLDNMVIDVAAVQKAHGMEMMMGGNAALAQIMGPNEDIAVEMDSVTKLVCLDCAVSTPIMALSGGG